MFKKIALTLIVVVVFPTLFPKPLADVAKSEKVTFVTEDKVTIAGTLYPALRKKGYDPKEKIPAVILIHMLRRDRTDWKTFAERLQGSDGFTVLSIDIRGHGESISREGATEPLSWKTMTDKSFNDAVLDVKAAVKFLQQYKELATDKVAIVGASIGGNIALNYAVDDKNVKTLILLSPGLEYHGVKTEGAIKKWGKRPAMIVASADDKYSLESSRKLLGKEPNVINETQIKLLEYKNAGHGTNMFGKEEPDLTEEICKWLKDKLK